MTPPRRQGAVGVSRARRDAVRAARAIVEAALDAASIGGRWPWSRRISLWIDTLLILEEAGGR